MFLPKIGLYVHIPWCLQRCPYCDFNVYQLQKHHTQINYVKHLIQDLKNDAKKIEKRTIKTIFIGGGTPSLLNMDLLKYLLHQIQNIIQLDKNSEISIEVNPETITLKKVLDYIKCGINRISFGIQSFNQNLLHTLGRKHSVKETIYMLNQIKNYTNINFNIDLIYGIPGQTLEQCLSDLKIAITINPNHISWYQLSIEKNTIFYYQKPQLPKESIIWNMYNQGNTLLIQSNYTRYEISSYTKNNDFCLHNMNYWKFGDYIGIGCGSHSKITKKNGNIIRIKKKKRIYEYCNKHEKYISKIITVTNSEKPIEYFMNLFRLFKPIKKTNFSLYTNLTLNSINQNIKKAILKKYLFQGSKYWYISNKGRNFLNNLIMLFM